MHIPIKRYYFYLNLNIYLREILESNNKKIEFMEINVPPQSQSNLKRFPLEFKVVKNVFQISDKINADKILFSSITSPTLIAIKILIRRFKDIKTIVIPHSILEVLNFWIPLIPTETIFWFKFWISFFNTPYLNYLILGPSIKEELIQKIPNLERYLYSTNLPFFFKNNKIKKYKKNDVLKFGYLGVGRKSKGIDLFLKLANDVPKENSKFIIIGPIIDGPYVTNSVYVPSPELPLNEEKYEKYIKDIDYAILLYNEDSYTLTASATLFDAISHLKPIIALRTPFFEYYFNKMGDIGYLCNNYEEIKELITNIIDYQHIDRYIIQQKNILTGRNQFRLDKLAEKLRTEW